MWNDEDGKVFIIAEIGQNHQGSLDIAKQMIQAAKNVGADCVKFQRSNLSEKFTADALARPYTGVNSWGSTYGEHKTFLEFSLDEYFELQRFATDLGIVFTASAMDMVSFDELETKLRVPFIKIGSGDADNWPLLRYALLKSIPLVISTGMQEWEHVRQLYNAFRSRNNIALLHCVSAYPTPPEDVMLQMIPLYRRVFPELTIGYSGHEQGLQLTVASVLLGAKIVERHFTLNKSWKGSDHQASLDPTEFARLVRYIRTIQGRTVTIGSVEESLKDVLEEEDFDEAMIRLAMKEITEEDRTLLQSEIPCHSKLGKSVVYARNIPAGHVLEARDLGVKVSDPQGISPRNFDSTVGKQLAQDVFEDRPVMMEHFKKNKIA